MAKDDVMTDDRDRILTGLRELGCSAWQIRAFQDYLEGRFAVPLTAEQRKAFASLCDVAWSYAGRVKDGQALH